MIFSSLPLFVTFMIKGHDVLFHLARIESIKDAMLAGEFPIKIYSDWLCGNGYALDGSVDDVCVFHNTKFI